MNRFARLIALPVLALALATAFMPAGAFAKRVAAPAAAKAAPEMPVPSTAPIPAGDYKLDRAHASLVFKLDHLGFSHYTARFRHFEADLNFDPAQPEKSALTATVQTKSLETDYPDAAKLDFNAELTDKQWLDAAQYPEIVFKSGKVTLTGGKTADIGGTLTLHGVTKPMVLHATYNGGWAGHPMDPQARIGFSATGTLQRSDFGVSMGIPAPGTAMGVGDTVTVILEAEFTGPPLATTKP
ncbi:MAG: YceI family protein [Micavibrio sp.]|nr:YceI family protein [Micavibrio sp.]